MERLINSIRDLRFERSKTGLFMPHYIHDISNNLTGVAVAIFLRNGKWTTSSFENAKYLVSKRHTKKSFNEICDIFKKCKTAKDVFKVFDFEKGCLLRNQDYTTLLGVYKTHMQLSSFYYNIKRILDDKSIKKVA